MITAKIMSFKSDVDLFVEHRRFCHDTNTQSAATPQVKRHKTTATVDMHVDPGGHVDTACITPQSRLDGGEIY